MSVRSRILQFQQNSSDCEPQVQSVGNSDGTNIINGNAINNHINISGVNNHISPTRKDPILGNSNNFCLNKNLSTSQQQHFTASSNFNGINGRASAIGSVTSNSSAIGNQFQYSNNLESSSSRNKTQIKQTETIPASSINFVRNSTGSSSSSSTALSMMNASQHSNNPPVNRATKPNLMTKKASMTINLASNTSSAESTTIAAVNHTTNSPAQQISGTNANINSATSATATTTQLRPKFGRSPSTNRTLPSPSSAIPKPFGSMASNGISSSSSIGTLGSNGSLSSGTVAERKSPGKVTPLTSPSKSHLPEFGGSGTSFGFGSSTGTGRLYGGIGWKEKFEESEKKRNHLVNLAQKATRDYEELRRRYHDVQSEYEKVSRRLDGATVQLDSLRKASEAVYEDYYKLKKRYESESSSKSDALTRVDQYNKENRRLKRQSAALMMQISDPTSLASAFDAVCETDSAENDKEIQYLRNRVQELENKVVDLESELEKTKLAEFETQESVMLMNDSVNSIKTENIKLKDQLKQLDEENRKATTTLEDVTFELDSLRVNCTITEEKLMLAETELKKLLSEKNILQRQSLVFLNNDEMDNRLMDALNQIGDLQTALDEQKNSFEAQITMLKSHLSDTELTEESLQIQTSAQIKALEEEVILLRVRAQEAEQKLEEMPAEPRGPPPPPPPPMPGLCPPPPPPPMMDGSLNNSLKSAMGTLRRASPNSNANGSLSECNTPPNGLHDGSPKSIVTQSPQIDDVVSQIKRGIRLKPTDRTLSRKPTDETHDKKDDLAVEEMRSILNNLRRTRR